MIKILNSSNGITLIALVITIIVLLILAGVTIATITGENGLLEKASTAGNETKKQQALEELKLKITEVQAYNKGDATLQDLENELKNDKSNEYIIEYIDGEMYVTYKKYQLKIDTNLNITVVGQDDNNFDTVIKARYLLVDVNGYFSSDGAVINELSVYDDYNSKVNYNVLTELNYDSVTKEISYYWSNMNYWNYTNLNDGNTSYTSNIEGEQNCTIFLYNGSSNLNTTEYARFIIDLGNEVNIKQIRFNIGGIEGRTPANVSVYKVINFIEGTGENTTYSQNIIQRNDEGLTKIAEKEFDEVKYIPVWYSFIEEKEEINYEKARYLLVDVNGYLSSNGAVINELSVYDDYNSKVNYNVLTELNYDSVAKGKAYYWTNASVWDYTNLNDGNTSYTSNIEGGQNCTLFLYSDSSNPNTTEYARFVIDLGDEVNIKQIRFSIGGVEGRTPGNVSVYKVNNFVEGTGGNTTYSQNIAQRNDEGLKELATKNFDTDLTTSTEINMINN